MVNWGERDYRELIRAAAQVGARPLDLLLVLFSESRLNPSAIAYVKGAPYARGLNQITAPNAKAMKLSDEEWASLSSGMSPAEQMPYVVRSIKAASFGKKAEGFYDAGELYQLNFAPASLSKGTADSLVLYSGGSAVENNKAFDPTGRGYITVGDLRRHLQKIADYGEFKTHVAKMKALDPTLEGPEIGGPFEIPWTFVGVTGAIALVMSALYGWQSGFFQKITSRKV